MTSTLILKVALPLPLTEAFDYLPPDNCQDQNWQVGMRVRVPFGRRGQLVGLLVATEQQSASSNNRQVRYQLKKVSEIVDHQPLLSTDLLKFCRWVSDYYHHPLGEVLMTALPKLLRQGHAAELQQPLCYQLTEAGRQQLSAKKQRAPKQAALLKYVSQCEQPLSHDSIVQQGFAAHMIKAVLEKKWIEQTKTTVEQVTYQPVQSALTLTTEQQHAINSINQAEGFHCHLLAGVTGSGKTEVYMQVIDHVLQQGKQAIVLVPEIGLTPQTISRFKQRFKVPIAVLHSHLTDKQRLQAWLLAANNIAKIIIGTRSAIFACAPKLGIIIVDEEHDHSYKQEAGLRYYARDIAVMRAQMQQVPIVLGSATPSLESLYNVKKQRYHYLSLPDRVGNAKKPDFNVVDLRRQRLQSGLSPLLIEKIKAHLQNNHQVMLFINRRGYAPAMMCHACGAVMTCDRCDAKLTWHHYNQRLICHHCQRNKSLPSQCPQCHQANLIPVGQGTERIEEALSTLFAKYNIIRIDRDKVNTRAKLDKSLQVIKDHHAHILIGTQMLAKGHHFPNLSLVAIVDADSGLFSGDFRALERMAQLIVQVSGRAGRSDVAGEVVLQTHHPHHPWLQLMLNNSYENFCQHLLKERQQASMPPYSYLALMRASATNAELPLQFLQQVKDMLQKLSANDVQILGPFPAGMERKAGRFRMRLMMQASQRGQLHHFLSQALSKIRLLKLASRCRWSLDVDPQDIF